MKYEKIVEYSNTKPRRITGVKRATYDKMVEILRKGYAEKRRWKVMPSMRWFWWTQRNRLLNVLKKATGYYSGKKKQHTLKTQLLVSLQTEEIIALAFSNGKRHDFQLFKDSRVHAKAETVLEADTGYQGLALIHPNSLLPKKRSKNHPLSNQERKHNREIAKQRIFVEHAIRFVKRFRILSERYRNRRHRFALRFSLFAGICNFDRFA